MYICCSSIMHLHIIHTMILPPSIYISFIRSHNIHTHTRHSSTIHLHIIHTTHSTILSIQYPINITLHHIIHTTHSHQPRHAPQRQPRSQIFRKESSSTPRLHCATRKVWELGGADNDAVRRCERATPIVCACITCQDFHNTLS